MNNRTMETNIGKISLAELDLIEDSLEVFIPVITVSERLKATIEENVRKTKAKYQKEFLDCKGKEWSEEGVIMTSQSLHITIKEKSFNYELCFNFEDKKDDAIFAGFELVADLSEHTEELKKITIDTIINKFF